jgi:hypothetical protein
MRRDLAVALGWDESKMSRRINACTWGVNDLPLLAAALRVTMDQLITPPENYLPTPTTTPTVAKLDATLRPEPTKDELCAVRPVFGGMSARRSAGISIVQDRQSRTTRCVPPTS